MEEDTDEEILSLKNRYERQLRQQTDENLKLRGDTGILRKKVIMQHKSMYSVHVTIFRCIIILCRLTVFMVKLLASRVT